jgi:hypothetical protein
VVTRTCAVNVTGWPTGTEAVDAVRVVAVMARETVYGHEFEADARLFASPEYVALKVRWPSLSVVVSVATPFAPTVAVPRTVEPS